MLYFFVHRFLYNLFLTSLAAMSSASRVC